MSDSTEEGDLSSHPSTEELNLEVDNDSESYDTDLEPIESDSKTNVTGDGSHTRNSSRCPRTSPAADRESASTLSYERSCSRLGVVPLTRVSEKLKSFSLDVPYCNIGPVGAQALARALRRNKSLCALDLREAGIQGIGADHLVKAILAKPDITEVNISGNFLGKEGALAIAELIRFTKTVSDLVLSCNQITDSEMDVISTAIKVNQSITSLDVSGNGISEVGAAKLGRALGKNETLSEIDLSWNKIRRAGAVGICKGLQESVSIHTVNLSWNGLGYEGALAVGHLLRENTQIRSLNLGNNRMHWREAMMIAKGLKENDSLQDLTLDQNPLTTTGCMDIIEAVFSETCGLKHLSLKGIPVINDFEVLAGTIRQMREFTYEHGGIVNSHDVLGQRHEKRIEPMRKVLDYMKERGLRPTELFRTFDKAVAQKMKPDAFVQRLKKAGINLPPHEVAELIDQIQPPEKVAVKASDINYKKVSRSVKSHIEKERDEKIMEREKERRLRRYHKEILSQELPPINEVRFRSNESDDDEDGGGSTSIRKSTEVVLPPSHRNKTPKIISLSRPLGSKPKPFGEGAKRKAKGKRRAKKKTRKSKS